MRKYKLKMMAALTICIFGLLANPMITLAEPTEQIETQVGNESQAEDGAQQKAAEQAACAEEAIDAFFDGTVMVGDSIMLGFRNYSARRANTFLGKLQFLAAGSFSVHNAFLPVNSANAVQPLYQGKKQHVWDSLEMMQPKRIFLFFGMNDIGLGGVEDSVSTYNRFIDRIKESCPDSEIHVISMTYTLAGKGKKRLNNTNIASFNAQMRAMALEHGWGFMELADRLSDGNGNLAPAYCSDNYVHQTNAAYEVWTTVLWEYAAEQIGKTNPYVAYTKNQWDAMHASADTAPAETAANE